MKGIRIMQVILWAAVVLWLGLALFLTLQNGTDTVAVSGGIARRINRILMRFGIDIGYANLHLMLRTAAHFFVFFVLGILTEAAVIASLRQVNPLKACIPALIVCTLISVLSEVMKMWIPGRHLQWDEVGLNVLGTWAGIVGTLGIYIIISTLREGR